MIELLPSREVALIIFGRPVHWYGVLYVLSFLMAIWLLPYLQKYKNLKMARRDWTELVSWSTIGVLVGGRLGYVLLYEPDLLWNQPTKVIAIWEGGMASHGGFVGVAFAVWLYVGVHLKEVALFSGSDLKKRKQQRRKLYWQVMDVVIVPAALGLALGRIGNVINQELFATPLIQGLAVGKNLLIAMVCWWYLRWGKSRPGGILAVFLIMYGLLRFAMEFARVQDYPLIGGLTRGQIYTIPFFVVGIVLAMYAVNNRLIKTNEHADKN